MRKFNVLSAALLGAVLAALLVTKTCAADRDKKAEQRTPPRLRIDTNALPKDSSVTSFAPVVKRVGPSVVTIYSTKSVRQSPGMSPLFDDPFFRRFFGVPEEEEPQPRGRGGRRPESSRMPKEQSLGSGVIISPDGYILSNNHVVEGADEVKVALSGTDTEYTAKVIGGDPQTDISVLKIDATNLTAITITDSDQLLVGDVVLAVGNPFGVGQTVTMGIASATGRGGFGIVDYEDFIQTDASINPGNSGGALIDAGGRLVGINTAIISRTGGNMGIGFAVPINMARRVMDSIVASGRVTRGYLGVMIGDITPQLADKLKVGTTSGAFVSDVPTDTPAAKAGLQPYDVITEFNGRKVPDSRQLRLWVAQTAPNSKVTLKVVRDGKEQTRNITLGELPTDQASFGPGGRRSPQQQAEPEALDGVEVADLDARVRRQFDIPSNIRGALITNIDPESNSAAAGLRPGDVIVEIERQKVANAQEAIDLSAKLKADQPVLLRIYSPRSGGTRVVIVEAEKPSESDNSR